MADPIETRRRRAIAESRLRDLIPAAQEVFGVNFTPIATVQRKHPDIHAAEVLEHFADFLKAAIEKKKGHSDERPTNRRDQRRSVGT